MKNKKAAKTVKKLTVKDLLKIRGGAASAKPLGTAGRESPVNNASTDYST